MVKPGLAPGVLCGVVHEGHEQPLVQPRQPAEVRMLEIRGGDLRHPADQRVIPEQASEPGKRVVRARDLGRGAG